jgi:hypothetical protein
MPKTTTKNSTKTVASGDFDVTAPATLDPVYTNPEFSKAADQLIEAIKRDLVWKNSEAYDGSKVLDIATKILESRLQ